MGNVNNINRSKYHYDWGMIMAMVCLEEPFII